MDSNHTSVVASSGSPCVMVIFGASGDLTKRKLIPALINLAKEKLLSTQFAIVGFAFDKMDTNAFRSHLTEELQKFEDQPVDPKLWDWFLERIYYVQGDFKDPEAYRRLKDQVAESEQRHGTQGNRFHYLAVSPNFFSEIVRQLGQVGLTKEENAKWTRVIVEKPFGHDLQSAIQLNKELKEILTEKQIYRIDHYLGKETVQNLLVFRFANSIIEPLWNRTYIDHVQITAAESVGVEHRGGFYETAGALKDMVPNHMFQLLTLTAMEPPISFEADAVRDKQAEILHALRVPTPEDVLHTTVRGQYGEGWENGEKVPAYRSEPSVNPESNTETFIARKMQIENWRWGGVPFYLRTGKRLAKRVTEIAVQFRKAPFMLFRKTPIKDPHVNRLVIHIQPDEGITLRFGAKIPGSVMRLGLVNMDFDYARDFGASHSTGYERLLYDCMLGDATLFQRADMVEAAWAAIEPVIDVFKALPARGFPNYAAGSWGPKEADELLAKDHRAWREIEDEEETSSKATATAKPATSQPEELQGAHAGGAHAN
jgi:glucose-6-phosphate 1-dehydrogenase